jgi:hypothetical protein
VQSSGGGKTMSHGPGPHRTLWPRLARLLMPMFQKVWRPHRRTVLRTGDLDPADIVLGLGLAQGERETAASRGRLVLSPPRSYQL